MSTTKKEIAKSLIYRIGSMGSGFAATALLIKILGVTNYGTWAALISLLAWIQLSDFGVGYALRNRIASSSKPSELLPLVSGVFQGYVLVALILIPLFMIFGGFISIVHQHPTESYILYIGTIAFFPLTIGTAVLQGMRKNSLTALMSCIQALLWVLYVWLLLTGKPSLFELSVSYVCIVLIVGLVQFFLGVKSLSNGLYLSIKTIIDLQNIRLSWPLWGVGGRFIVLQLTSVILFSLGTYLTYSHLSAADAAKYDVLNKFFQLPLVFFNIVISVYWTEIARLMGINDRKKLFSKFKQLHLIAISICFLMIIFSIFIAAPLARIYTSNKILLSLNDTLCFFVLISVQIFAYVGAVFLNASEKLLGQILVSAFGAAAFIPLVKFFYSMNFGFSAVPLATTFLIIPSVVYCNYAAFYYVIKKNN